MLSKIGRLKQSILFKNTLIYTLTEVINKAVPFMLLPVLTIYLTPSDYGIVSVFEAFTSILAVFMHLGMIGAIRVNFFKLSKEQLRIYIANTILIFSVSSLILFGLIYIFKDILSIRLEIPSIWILIGVIVTFFHFFTTLNLGLWQVEQRAKPFGIYQIVSMLSRVFIVLLLVVGLGMGWKGQLAGYAIATIFFALLSFVLIYQRGYLSFSLNKIYIEDALKFGIPLIPHALSWWFRTGVDRIFLTMFIGSTATGLYSVGYQFGLILGTIVMAFNQSYSPYLYKKLKEINDQEKIELVKQAYLYFVAVLLLALILSLLMPYIITYFLDSKYQESSQYVPWIAFGYAFLGMYLMVVNYIFFMKKTVALAIVTFTSSILHIFISFFMIKINGAIGAAQATTISFFIMFVAVWILSAKVYKMPWGLIWKN